MKYIMKNGSFVCKENNNETVNAISGTIVGLRTVKPEEGSEAIQIDLKEGEGEDAVVRTLSILKYGDASLKILRCLFGIAEIIIGKVITISLEEREGHKALITISADGEVLPACGTVEPYAYDKKLLTDKILVVLKRCFEYKTVILVYGNKDGFYPVDEYDEFDFVQSANYIRDLRRAGRAAELTLKKTVFNNASATKGYLKALGDLSGVANFKIIHDEDGINTLMEAFTEDLPAEEEVVGAAQVDENGHEIEA